MEQTTTTKPTTELEAQIELERLELENAPKIPIAQFQPKETGTAGRCGWCGRIALHLVFVETVDGVDRFKGECCGQRHY